MTDQRKPSVYDLERAYGLNRGIRCATYIMNWSNSLRRARARGDAYAEGWSLGAMWTYALDLHDEGADAAVVKAMLKESLGDALGGG